jgi:hypothetical protein
MAGLAPLMRFFAGDRRLDAREYVRDLSAENRRLRRLLASVAAISPEDGAEIDFEREPLETLVDKLHAVSLQRAAAIREAFHATGHGPLV